MAQRPGLSMDGVVKKGLPKFNPQPGRGMNPGPSVWQSEILPTVSTSPTHRLVLVEGNNLGEYSSPLFTCE